MAKKLFVVALSVFSSVASAAQFSGDGKPSAAGTGIYYSSAGKSVEFCGPDDDQFCRVDQNLLTECMGEQDANFDFRVTSAAERLIGTFSFTGLDATAQTGTFDCAPATDAGLSCAASHDGHVYTARVIPPGATPGSAELRGLWQYQPPSHIALYPQWKRIFSDREGVDGLTCVDRGQMIVRSHNLIRCSAPGVEIATFRLSDKLYFVGRSNGKPVSCVGDFLGGFNDPLLGPGSAGILMRSGCEFAEADESFDQTRMKLLRSEQDSVMLTCDGLPGKLNDMLNRSVGP